MFARQQVYARPRRTRQARSFRGSGYARRSGSTIAPLAGRAEGGRCVAFAGIRTGQISPTQSESRVPRTPCAMPPGRLTRSAKRILHNDKATGGGDTRVLLPPKRKTGAPSNRHSGDTLCTCCAGASSAGPGQPRPLPTIPLVSVPRRNRGGLPCQAGCATIARRGQTPGNSKLSAARVRQAHPILR
jgi:hypothetical protein